MNPYFDGRTMTCILCDAKEVARPDKESKWRCIEADGWPMFACPKHFPPDNSDAAAFKASYLVALEKVRTLFAARKCRVCGCTDKAACGPDGCAWVEWNLCSNCVNHAVPVKMQIGLLLGMYIVSGLQLACRHPEIEPAARLEIERFARALQGAVSRSPELAASLAAGWDEEIAAESQSQIIVP